jgi:hypothetical protein
MCFFFYKKTHDIVKRKVNLNRRGPRQFPIFLEIETIADSNTLKFLLYSTLNLNTRSRHPLIFY